MDQQKTYYEILECNRNATFDEIKKSYQRLALKHHPDKSYWFNEILIAENKFPEIDEAFKILRDPEQRRIYDAELYQQSISNHTNIFAEISQNDMLSQHRNDEDGKLIILLTYPCRCGSFYTIESTEISDDLFSIECDECSLTIIVKNVTR